MYREEVPAQGTQTLQTLCTAVLCELEVSINVTAADYNVPPGNLFP